MKIEMKKKMNSVTEETIKRLETKINAKLPIDYRNFLLNQNGGRPETEYFFEVKGWRGKRTLINDFFGLLPGKSIDVWENIEWLEERIPIGFIPIAHDPGGNCILLGLIGESTGRIYFWDHEDGPELSSSNLEDFPNVYFLASGFLEFLKKIGAYN